MTHRVRTLIFAASLSILSTAISYAQKPALVENVDERGRVPYQQTVTATCLTIDQSCVAKFPPIPAGYRLVVTYITGSFQSAEARTGLYAELYGTLPLPGSTGNDYVPMILVMNSMGYATGGYVYILSTPLSYYLNAGDTPVLFLQNGFTSQLRASLVGYLVAIG